jgi:hypothetical protein
MSLGGTKLDPVGTVKNALIAFGKIGILLILQWFATSPVQLASVVGSIAVIL